MYSDNSPLVLLPYERSQVLRNDWRCTSDTERILTMTSTRELDANRDSEEGLSDPPILEEEDDLDILDLLIIPVRYKFVILKVSFSVAVLTAIYTLILPNIFTASARILPPQPAQSLASSLLSQIGPLTGLTGRDLGVRNPNDLYVSMLKSRTVAVNLIHRFSLQQLYERKTETDTIESLKQVTRIASSKEGIIEIEVDDKDPTRAANMANAYVEELFRLTQNLAVTEASQRRLFFENQLKIAKDELSTAEAKLKDIQETTGLIEPSSQGKAIIESTATLRALIGAKEVEISSMRSFAAAQNPDLVRAEQELSSLRQQLAKLQKDKNLGAGDIQVPTAGIPAASLTYVRALRDVKYYETMFELLAKQFELAKIDEAKTAPAIQFLDRASVPEKKSRPKRTITVLIATLLAASLTVLWAFVKEGSRGLQNNPRKAEKLKLFKQLLKFRGADVQA